MKKNLFALGAIALAVVFSSFTTKFSIDNYLVFTGGTNEKLMSNYAAPTTSQPAHEFSAATPILNWFRVVDVDSDGVENSEFLADFEIYDVISDISNKLSDESADIVGQLDLRNKQ
jgi:hypothetical protein